MPCSPTNSPGPDRSTTRTPSVGVLAPHLDEPRQQEVHGRRGFALLDEVGAGGEPLHVDEVGRVTEHRGLAREDRQRLDELLRPVEALGQVDDPGGEAVAQQHAAAGQVAVVEPHRRLRPPRVAGRGDRRSHGDVVGVPGEPVRPERDDDVRADLVEQPGGQLEQRLVVELRQAAVAEVEAPRRRRARGRAPQPPAPVRARPSGWPAWPAARHGSGRPRPWSARRRGRPRPRSASLAKVPPAHTVSSSGCAKTPRTRTGRPETASSAWVLRALPPRRRTAPSRSTAPCGPAGPWPRGGPAEPPASRRAAAMFRPLDGPIPGPGGRTRAPSPAPPLRHQHRLGHLDGAGSSSRLMPVDDARAPADDLGVAASAGTSPSASLARRSCRSRRPAARGPRPSACPRCRPRRRSRASRTPTWRTARARSSRWCATTLRGFSNCRAAYRSSAPPRRGERVDAPRMPSSAGVRTTSPPRRRIIRTRSPLTVFGMYARNGSPSVAQTIAERDRGRAARGLDHDGASARPRRRRWRARRCSSPSGPWCSRSAAGARASARACSRSPRRARGSSASRAACAAATTRARRARRAHAASAHPTAERLRRRGRCRATVRRLVQVTDSEGVGVDQDGDGALHAVRTDVPVPARRRRRPRPAAAGARPARGGGRRDAVRGG